MNKKHIPGVIVVEGKHDVSKLSNIYDSVYVVTNGYDIPQEEVNFLKALKPYIQVIILTDNDDAGDKIRARLNEIRNNVINVKISAPKYSKKKGIAECLNNDIQNALDKYVKEEDNKPSFDLYKLGITGKENSKELRKQLSNKFNLGIVNKENIINRLNLLDISLEELKEEIKDATSR